MHVYFSLDYLRNLNVSIKYFCEVFYIFKEMFKLAHTENPSEHASQGQTISNDTVPITKFN